MVELGTIVFHDEQTLAGWQVEEAVAALGAPLTVLSVPNAGELRTWEYVGDGLDAHVERVVRLVDGYPEPVGLGGSSFGASASLYAWARQPRVFTRVLAMSPAFWRGRERLFEAVAAVEPAPGTRLWIDIGGRESERSRAGYADMQALLESRGCVVGGGVEPEGTHDEAAWGQRLPEALRFLYAPAA